MRSEAFETLFGGAAGGGKSHGQLLDALRFAVVYPGSRQLMLRRTMPELERSLVPAALRLYPQSVASYKVSEHRWDFINGSTLEFGYCDAESDVTKYQSAARERQGYMLLFRPAASAARRVILRSIWTQMI